MKESSTYQAIVREGRAEGRAEEARRLVLLLGEKRFGAADEAVQGVLESTTDIAQLEEFCVRIVSAESWQELLAPRGRRRRKTKG